MKKFYAKYGELTPEQWLVQAIHGQTDFSFSVPSIPNEDFLPNFKQKYEFYFIRLDATTGQMSELKDHSSFGKAANLNSHHISATNTAQIEEKQGEGPVMCETHVNLVDNSIVPKIEQVSYSLDEPLDCLNLATRPQETKGLLDLHFEQLMKRRMKEFHPKQIDRTQYDTDMLEK